MSQAPIPAGVFSEWLDATRSALKQHTGMQVPCGDCTACCTSAYFIHIDARETETLRMIPQKLRFPAPGSGKKDVVLGYLPNGHCPMFAEHRCSIYGQRPFTCRMYDCRIFAAIGIMAGGDDKAHINARIRQWQFSFPSPRDHEAYAAVKAAYHFLAEYEDKLPPDARPKSPSERAIVAIIIGDVFLPTGNIDHLSEVISPDQRMKRILDILDS